MTFTAEQYLKENSFSEFDPELNGKSTCVEIETALAAVAMAREEVMEQMMKDTIEGTCISNNSECGSTIDSPAGMLFLQKNKFNESDKVKIIIVKQD